MPVSYTHLDVYKRQGKDSLVIADFALRKLPLSVRWAVIIVLGIVVLVAIVCVYGQIDGIIWSSELTRLIGHPYSDVLRLKSRSTGFDLLESDRELYAAVSYTHLDVYKRQAWQCHRDPQSAR